MTKEDLYILLLADLNILSPDETRKAQLGHLIDAAISFIEREGVELSTPFSVEDGHLIIMYAAYLFRKRDTTEEMPRMLRWALNNRIFGGGKSAT